MMTKEPTTTSSPSVTTKSKKPGIEIPLYEGPYSLEQLLAKLPSLDRIEVERRWVNLYWKKKFDSGTEDIKRGNASIIGYIGTGEAYKVLINFLLGGKAPSSMMEGGDTCSSKGVKVEEEGTL